MWRIMMKKLRKQLNDSVIFYQLQSKRSCQRTVVLRMITIKKKNMPNNNKKMKKIK